MKQETGEINDPIKIKEEVQEILPRHVNDESDCLASVVKEEINDLIQIKEEVQETLPTHDFNESDCLVSDDKKVIYNLLNIKEELDPIAADDYNQIGGKPLNEESTQEDSNEQITPKPKQCVNLWINSMNKEQIQNELRKLGLDTPRTIDKCRTVLRNHLKSKSVNQKEQNFKQEAAEKCVLPLVPDGQQVLQPTEELILPDLLTASSSSQNDSEINKSKHLCSDNDSASASCMEVTKLGSLDSQLIRNRRLSIFDKTNKKCGKNIEKTSKGSRSKLTAPEKRRSTTGYTETPVNSNPVASHQGLDAERKQINNRSSSSNLKRSSVVLNKTNWNKNECSVEPESICPKSTKLDNVKLVRNSSEACDENQRNNFSDNVDYGNGDSNVFKQIGPNINKVVDTNKCNTRNRIDFEPNMALKSNRVYFSCKLCGRKFDRKYKLRLHEESKCGSVKLFGCNICGKGFMRKSYMMEHVSKDHSSKKSEKFNCDLCNNWYFSRPGLAKHKNKYHFSKTYSVMLTCEYCQKTFTCVDNLKKHVLRKHRRSEMKRFECAYCSQVFVTRCEITTHIHSKHLQTQAKCKVAKRFICEQCGKVLSSKYSLSTHFRSHSDEKPFLCQTCGKCFKSEHNLSQHSVTHSDIRPFSCDICSKSFRIRNHLKQHMGVHGLVNTAVKQRQMNKKENKEIKK